MFKWLVRKVKPQPQSKPAEGNTTSGDLLEHARFTLEMADKLAPLAPVPFASSIFSSAQMIVELAIRIREDKQMAREFANFVAELTRQINETIRGREQLVVDLLKAALEELDRVLKEAKECMEGIVNRGWLKRLVRRRSVSEQLDRHKLRISHALNTFLTTSSIRQEQTLQKIGTQLDGHGELLIAQNRIIDNDRTYDDDDFLVYRPADIYHVQRTEVPFHDRPVLVNRTERETECYDAEVRGQNHVRVVKYYRNPQKFDDAVQILSYLRNSPDAPKVNIAQLEGYSRRASKSSQRFLVLGGPLRPFFNLIYSLDPMGAFVKYIHMNSTILETTLFLNNSGFQWQEDHDKLMVNSYGEVVLGVHDDVVKKQDDSRLPRLSRWPFLATVSRTVEYRQFSTLTEMQDLYTATATIHRMFRSPEAFREKTVDDVVDLWTQTFKPRQVANQEEVISLNYEPETGKDIPKVGIGYVRRVDEDGKPAFQIYAHPGTEVSWERYLEWTSDDGTNFSDPDHDFSSPSNLKDMKSANANIRTYVSDLIARDQLMRYSSALAPRRPDASYEVVFVSEVKQTSSAQLLTSNNAQEFPHIRAFMMDRIQENGFLRSPWGGFVSEEDRPAEETDDLQQSVLVRCLKLSMRESTIISCFAKVFAPPRDLDELLNRH